MDENKGASIIGNLEKKEDQEETNSFLLFHSQFGKMSLTENLQVVLLQFLKVCCLHISMSCFNQCQQTDPHSCFYMKPWKCSLVGLVMKGHRLELNHWMPDL